MNKQELTALCEQYAPLSPRDRLETLLEQFEDVLVTSSFGATSAMLLHQLSRVQPEYPIHFIDTGYHFSETINYKDLLTTEFGLNVLPVLPGKIENTYTQMYWTWAYDPDTCCAFNKVSPLDALKNSHDVWISGMVGGTTERRKNLPLFKFDGQILRFYPFIDMTDADAQLYMDINELPIHPLVDEGYGSIGCTHCTVKGEGRAGRWAGKKKNECGLHLF